ncbi:MAG: WD40/YVTN/BNR-like repeat-containing protein [Candidatus Kapaibacterium sp.]
MTVWLHVKLFRSLDRGQSWEVIGDFYAGDQVYGNEDVLFYTEFASIYRSFDRGDSWEPINVKGLPRANGSLTSQYQNGHLYLSVVDLQTYYKDEVQARDTITGSIFRSDDNGETWIGLGHSLPIGLYAGREMRRISNMIVKHDTISLFVRDSTYTNLRLFVSIDRGENWNELEVPQSLMPIRAEFNGDDIYLGTIFYSVLQSKLDISSSVPTPGIPPHSSTATLAFDQTQGLIDYTLSTPNEVRLALYSMEGREVMTLADEYREVGTYRVQIGSLPIPHGLYLLVLQTGEESIGRLIRQGDR